MGDVKTLLAAAAAWMPHHRPLVSIRLARCSYSLCLRLLTSGAQVFRVENRAPSALSPAPGLPETVDLSISASSLPLHFILTSHLPAKCCVRLPRRLSGGWGDYVQPVALCRKRRDEA